MDLGQWVQFHIPFAAFFSTTEIHKRPIMTRAVENILVGVIGGAFAAYVTISTLQSVHSAQIDDIRQQIAQEHADTVTQIQSLQAQISNIQTAMLGSRFSGGKIR